MQPKVESWAITCQKCKGRSRIRIVNGRDVLYLDHTPIIACRLRPDTKWGFECMCGNDTRLAPQERHDAGLLIANAEESVVKRIVKAATATPERNFEMVPA
jgi:hypothetical protein